MPYTPYDELNSQNQNARQKHYAMLRANPHTAINQRASLSDTDNAKTQQTLRLGHRPHYKSMQKHTNDDVAMRNKLDKLANALKSVKGYPEKVSAVATKALKEPGMKPQEMSKTLGTILDNTEGADKIKVMADFQKDSPQTASQMLASMKDKTSFAGADLTTANPKDVAAVISPTTDMQGARLPANVDLSQKNLDGVSLDGVQAPGLIVYGAKGKFSAKGAEVANGAINNTHSEVAIGNAAMLAMAGAKVDPRFTLTNATGENRTTMTQASQMGFNGVKTAMQSAVGKQNMTTHTAPSPFGTV